MDNFWIAQINDLLDSLPPEEVKDALRSSISETVDSEKIISLVDQQVQLRVSHLLGLSKSAQDEEPMYEIWVQMRSNKLLFSRPKNDDELTKHLSKILHESVNPPKRKDIEVRKINPNSKRAQTDYVGFGNDQAQSNFATPNSEGETGAGTSVSTDGLQGPGGSYLQRALLLKERQKKKRTDQGIEEAGETKEEMQERRKQRAALTIRIAAKPGDMLSGPKRSTQETVDTVEDAKEDIIKDTETVQKEVEETTTKTDDSTQKTTKKTKDMSDTVEEVSDNTEESSTEIQNSANEANDAVTKLKKTIEDF